MDDIEEVENKKLHPDNPWVCPNCGSTHVHCHAGMFVDRFECLDCHLDWK